MPAFLISLVRTGAGYAAAWLLSLKLAGPVLDLFGWDSATAQQRLVGGFVLVAGTAWYFAVRALEQRWPQLGIFLGIPAKPVYGPPALGAGKTAADDAIGDDPNAGYDPAA